MKFKLEEVVKEHRVKPHNPNGQPEHLVYGPRPDTVRERVEKVVIEAGDHGLRSVDISVRTGLNREQVMSAIYRSPNIKLVPGHHKYGKKRYYYEI